MDCGPANLPVSNLSRVRPVTGSQGELGDSDTTNVQKPHRHAVYGFHEFVSPILHRCQGIMLLSASREVQSWVFGWPPQRQFTYIKDAVFIV